jgi:hypothetical protein
LRNVMLVNPRQCIIASSGVMVVSV